MTKKLPEDFILVEQQQLIKQKEQLKLMVRGVSLGIHILRKIIGIQQNQQVISIINIQSI